MINIVKIPWDRVGEAVPAFLTIVTMPFTYSGERSKPAPADPRVSTGTRMPGVQRAFAPPPRPRLPAVAYGFIAGIIGYVIINWSVFAINYVEVGPSACGAASAAAWRRPAPNGLHTICLACRCAAARCPACTGTVGAPLGAPALVSAA